MAIEADAIPLFFVTIGAILLFELVGGLGFLRGQGRTVLGTFFCHWGSMLLGYVLLIFSFMGGGSEIFGQTASIGLFLLLWGLSCAMVVRLISLLIEKR